MKHDATEELLALNALLYLSACPHTHTPKLSKTIPSEGVCACVTYTQPEINRSAHISQLHHTDQADQLLKEDLTRPDGPAAGGTTNVTILHVLPAGGAKTLEGHDLGVKLF